MSGLWDLSFLGLIYFSWLTKGTVGGTRGLSEVNALKNYLLRLHPNNQIFIRCWMSLSSHWSWGKGTLWIQLLLDKAVGVAHWHLFQLSKISALSIQVTEDKAGFKNWEGNLNMFQHLLPLEAEMLPAMWCVFSYAVQAYIFVCFSQ